MSFLESIRTKKGCLNPTETKVTLPSGCVTVETKTGVVTKNERSLGFVVDTKPDLQVALVVDHLFMGSQDPALDVALLKKYKIRHILSLGVEVPHYDDFKYHYFPVLDIPEYDLSSLLKETNDLIHSVRKLKENIYVHCNAGVSRSSTVIIAYLMQEKSWTYDEAYEYLKQIRSSICPNGGFVKQLKNQ